MASWATTSDVEASLGRSLTAGAEVNRATMLLTLATAEARRITGKRYTAGEHSIERTPDSRGRVWIPAPAANIELTSVRAIDDCTGSATDLTAGESFTSRGRVIYGLRYPRVEVTFTLGADCVPDDVVGVVAGIVAGTISGPPVGMSAQTVGEFSVSYVNNSGRVYLTNTDRAILASHADPMPAIDNLAG